MKKNIGKKGRLLRLAIAILLLIYALWSPSWTALVIGVFVLFESYFSWCALNHFLRRRSNW